MLAGCVFLLFVNFFRLERYLRKRCFGEKIQIKDRAEQDPAIVELCDRFRAHRLKECAQAIVTNLRYYCYVYNLNKFFLEKIGNTGTVVCEFPYTGL